MITHINKGYHILPKTNFQNSLQRDSSPKHASQRFPDPENTGVSITKKRMPLPLNYTQKEMARPSEW